MGEGETHQLLVELANDYATTSCGPGPEKHDRHEPDTTVLSAAEYKGRGLNLGRACPFKGGVEKIVSDKSRSSDRAGAVEAAAISWKDSASNLQA